QRPTGAMEVAGAEEVVLDALVVWEHIAPAPSGIALRLPFIEIRGLAADIDHGVDRARSAQQLSAWHVIGATAECRDRLGPVHPIDAWIVVGLAVTDGDLHPEAAIGRARLEQQHAVTPVLAEPAR